MSILNRYTYVSGIRLSVQRRVKLSASRTIVVVYSYRIVNGSRDVKSRDG